MTRHRSPPAEWQKAWLLFPEPLVVLDAEGRVVTTNDLGKALLGVDDAFVGADFGRIVTDLSEMERREALNRARCGDVVRLEGIAVSTSGSKPLPATVSLRATGSDFDGFLLTIREAEAPATRRLPETAHRFLPGVDANEARRSEAEQRHRAFLDASPDLMLLIAEDGRYLDFHAGPEVKLYAPPEVFLGRPVAEVMPPEVVVAYNEALAALKATGQAQTITYGLDVDGDPRTFEARIVACEGARVALLARDVTERERARALVSRLAQAEKLEALGVLAGGIAHDFNNILAAITNFSQLLQKALPPSAASRAPAGRSASEFADEIVRAANRGRDLAAELVAFARGGEPKKRPMSLTPVIEEAARAATAARADVRVELFIDPATPKVVGDASQLYRVVANLAKNAVDALGNEPGTITLRLDPRNVEENDPAYSVRPGRYARLTVCDDGEGIGEDTMSRIFDPFFTSKPAGVGTGLGLSVVHGIVRNHRGEVQVYSRLGEGTTFEILLPAAGTEAPTAHVSSEPAAMVARILLVEDDANVGRSLVLLLESSGYGVVLERDPRKALDRLDDVQAPVDLVLADFLMPTMDGLELARRVGAKNPLLPVVLLTGCPLAIDDEIRRAGIRAVLSKPVALRELESTLSSVLSPRASLAVAPDVEKDRGANGS